jgi:uncharacterized phage-associated protein
VTRLCLRDRKRGYGKEPMRFVYDSRKAAQAASLLLDFGGGTMPYIKLIKLLYLADRQALIDTGLPITGDRMVSMDHGPVLSQTLDNINMGQPPLADSIPWLEYISEPQGYDVSARKSETDQLSPYEIEILRNIYGQFGKMDKWTLIKYTHTLAEWHDPQGSSIPIDPAEILRDAGKSTEEIETISEQGEELWFIRRLAR